MQTQAASPEFVAWFTETVDKLARQARFIIKSGAPHAPMLFVYPEDDDLAAVVIPLGMFFDDAEGKDLATLLHQRAAADTHVKCCILCTESWVLSGKVSALKGTLDDMKKGISEHPDRKEALFFNGINRHGMQLLAAYEIERPENTIPDKPTHLMDAAVGILVGEGAGESVKGALGRMILPGNKKPINGER